METEKTSLDAITIWLAGIAGIAMVLVAIVLTVGVFRQTEHRELLEKSSLSETTELVDLQTAQEAKLNSYRWVDKPNGVVGIPIDRAMTLVREEIAAK
ncbi:hypothetical protein ACFL2H_03290 [Planctomycetota bacterium]